MTGPGASRRRRRHRQRRGADNARLFPCPFRLAGDARFARYIFKHHLRQLQHERERQDASGGGRQRHGRDTYI